jgi:hypothetical protein
MLSAASLVNLGACHFRVQIPSIINRNEASPHDARLVEHLRSAVREKMLSMAIQYQDNWTIKIRPKLGDVFIDRSSALTLSRFLVQGGFYCFLVLDDQNNPILTDVTAIGKKEITRF